MAKQLLTDNQCANARIKKGEKPDKLLADGNGLFLRVRQQVGVPTKTWLFVYSLAGRRGKHGLGPYPSVGLARARGLAQESREAVEQGRDPAAAREALERARAAEEAAKAGRPTVQGLFSDWYELEGVAKRKSGAEVKRALEKDVLPLIGRMYADEVRRRDVMRVLDQVKKRGVKRYANYLLQYLRQMFSFAVTREIVASDPTFGIKRKDAGGKPVRRDRVLKDAEVHELGTKLSHAGLSHTAEAAFWFILATCCRVGELARAKWSEFDDEARAWTIPAAHTKNGREHVIHLSGFALRQFKTLEKYATSKVWVFPNAAGTSHIDPKSLQKQFRDRQRSKQIKGRSKQLGVLALKSGRWTVHDLRRTGATIMGELGVRPDVIERVLNHKPADELVETYQRQQVMAFRAEAFRLLGDRLDLLSRQSPGKVVAGKFGNKAA